MSSAFLEKEILETLNDHDVEARPRLMSRAVWDEISYDLAYYPVDYSQAMINYQLSYFSNDDATVIDGSVVIYNGGQPVAIWPLMVLRDVNQNQKLLSNGGPILPPLFVERLTRKAVNRLNNSIVGAVSQIWERYSQRDRTTGSVFDGSFILNNWHEQWMRRNARLSIKHDLILDLSKPLSEVQAGFRKSYRPLISKGKSLWNATLVTDFDKVQWEEFHRLHIDVSGRVTRTNKSWDIQLDAVASGDAFFIILRDTQEKMIGGALFYSTRDEGLYAVGVYDRSHFDKPVGHVVQALAIEEFMRRGVRWYRLGSRAYMSDNPAPSEKEINISEFKQGFSSHLVPRFQYDLRVAN